MFKKKLLLLILIFSLPAFSAETKCEAWFQNPGQALEKIPMAVSSRSEKNIIYTLSFKGYDYKVDWDIRLTTFYVSITFAGKLILITTARVPTADHPENFTDLNLPTGPRLAVGCELN